MTTALAVCCLAAWRPSPSRCAARYVTGEDVLALCAEVDFPPCLMMRRMLELLMRLSKQVRALAASPRIGNDNGQDNVIAG